MKNCIRVHKKDILGWKVGRKEKGNEKLEKEKDNSSLGYICVWAFRFSFCTLLPLGPKEHISSCISVSGNDFLTLALGMAETLIKTYKGQRSTRCQILRPKLL